MSAAIKNLLKINGLSGFFKMSGSEQGSDGCHWQRKLAVRWQNLAAAGSPGLHGAIGFFKKACLETPA
jgi:hypothetical protein